MSPSNNENYDRKTLYGAAALLIGFCAITYFLPDIMMFIGTKNAYLTGAVIGAFLVLPFVGLWWRGRVRSKKN